MKIENSDKLKDFNVVLQTETFIPTPKMKHLLPLISGVITESSYLQLEWSKVCFNGCDPVVELAVILDFYLFSPWSGSACSEFLGHGCCMTLGVFFMPDTYKYAANIGCFLTLTHDFRYFIYSNPQMFISYYFLQC